MAKKNVGVPLVLSRATPHKSAQKFRDAIRPNLINQQGEWLDWDGHAYVAVEDATINSELELFARGAYTQTSREVTDGEGVTTREISHDPFNAKPKDLAAIHDMLKRQNHKRADTLSPPCWLGAFKVPKPLDVISVENGLLDITSGEMYAPTPEFFTRTSLPIVYDADAPAPALWLKFLHEVFDGDLELVELLQEIFGYLISGETKQHAVFFLWGPPRTGKGTVLRVITELVGKLNCSNPSVADLAERFGYEGCIGKSLLKVTDVNCDNKDDLSKACSKINAISGEDDITAQRKNILDWNGRLPSRVLMAGNRLPNFGGGSIALAARLIILPFKVSFVGREDRDLTDKLLTELPSILNWALAGLAKLRARPRFPEPEVSLQAKTRMLYQSDPVRGFIDDRCVIEADAWIEKSVFYSLYKSFCQEIGTHSAAMPTLSERLQEIYPSIAAAKKRKPSEGAEAKRPIFTGVRLTGAAMFKVYKVDREAFALGAEGPEALELDADGWPIKRPGMPDFDD